MEARMIRGLVCLITGVLSCQAASAASVRTANFLVSAPSPRAAQEIAQMAEHYRSELAKSWLGRELPRWREICPIRATIRPDLGAGGATSFYFQNGEPRGWTMSIQGPHHRILDSVLPHEVLHTIFATHFGRPLPRWADEGACTTVEHVEEKQRQHQMLYEFLTTNRGIAFNRLFAMKEYPSDVFPLYSQGYSLARFLIAQGGRQKFVRYVGEGMQTNDWPGTTRRFYEYDDLSDLQLTWLDWVRKGCPPLAGGSQVALASAESSVPQATEPQGTKPQANGRPAASTPNGKTDQGSWYARTAAASRNGTAPPAPQRPSGATPPAAPPRREAVTRPQNFQQPGQVILEATRGGTLPGYAPGSIGNR